MAAATPTIVLVHGAWADATGFDAEIRALRDRGYTAIGFATPLRGIRGDAAYLAGFLRTLTGPIVLVGHSYGGIVTSNAATGNDQVRALVYLAHSCGARRANPMLVRSTMRASRSSMRSAGTPARASRRPRMIFVVTGWGPTRQRTPSNAPGNWVMAAKVELQPRQRLRRPIVMSRVSGRLRA
jgi:pimeloyl-ACP methyl ester carboxylesterase